MRSALYEGQVVHDRRSGLRNLFRYRVYMWHVDLDELGELDRRLWAFGHDRPALTTVRARDHLGDPRRPIRESRVAKSAVRNKPTKRAWCRRARSGRPARCSSR